jgi:hypothetical protein
MSTGGRAEDENQAMWHLSIQGRDTQTAHIGIRARLVKYGDIFVAFVVYTG